MYILPDNILEYFKGCLIPQVSLDDWISMYEIPTRPLNCPLCSQELEPLAPVALNESRGVIYNPCSCEGYPKNQAPVRFGSSTKEKRLKDKAFAQNLINILKHY